MLVRDFFLLFGNFIYLPFNFYYVVPNVVLMTVMMTILKFNTRFINIFVIADLSFKNSLIV